MIVRLIIETANEWGFGWVVISLDLDRAFENVKLSELLKHWETRGVPTRIRYAVFKEIAGTKFVRYSLGPYLTDYLPKQKGLIQGSHESSFFFLL